jgi:two-component system, OmpR family, phosphate regulon response regulator OmpR
MPERMDDQHHILVVDDDKRIRELLVTYLGSNGYRVTAAANAAEARKAMAGLAYDVIVLDVMMPGENGLDFAANLRVSSNAVPILMLSARTDAADRIKGLAQGSDDYLGKPFEPEELLLRLRNLTKRNTPAKMASRVVRFGDCVFDMDTGELQRADERVHVTGREREILRMLIQADGKPVARAAFQPHGSDEAARAIDVQVNRLRQKIEKDPTMPLCLQTVRGEGYCLITESV